MFARSLAKITASIPSSVKYRLSRLEPIYRFVLSFGQPSIEVQTLAGPLRWRINRLTTGNYYLLGTYELYMQKAFLAYVRAGMVVYDIGAYVGFHSLFCGLLVGPSGQVIAFEPTPESRAYISEQILLNPRIPVSLFPYALSDHCGMVGLDIFQGSPKCNKVTEAGDITAEAVTIDSLVATRRIPPPQLIKIDVEGHDLRVLKGAKDTLERYAPVILCDYNLGISVARLEEVLTALGYSVFDAPPLIALPKGYLCEADKR